MMTEPQENSPYYTEVLAGAIEMNEIFKVLVAAGFLEDQALKIVSNLMLQNVPPERRNGDQG
jgi:hypothetical protein